MQKDRCATRIAGAVCGLLCLLATESLAGPREQISVGARPLAMGEAFVAVADDGNALYWNPAGIVTLTHHEISSMYSDLFGLGIASGYVGYVYPLTDRYAIGTDWSHLGFDDGELGFNQDLFKLSGAVHLRQSLNLGLSIKYLTSRTDIAYGPVGSSDGMGMDLGALWVPARWIRFGVMLQDLTNTKLRHNNGSSEIIYHRSTRIGVAARPWEQGLIAVDFDDRFHVGAEYWIANTLALRGGLQKDLHTHESVALSTGVGLIYKFLKLDYALTGAPTLGATHRFSLSAFFNLGKSVVDIRKATVRDIFPSQLARYPKHSPCSAELFNRSDHAIEATVSLNVPGLMDSPSDTVVVLRPQVVTDVQIPAVFNESLLSSKGDRPARATIAVSYSDDRKTRTSKKPVTTTVYARGAIRWADNTGAAAAFVTSTDPRVTQFARHAVQAIGGEKTLTPESPDIARAAAIFEALGAYGVRYTPDANNPYSVVSLASAAVDNVQYPREMLETRSGDCDDAAALYCALLENIGIATALVDIPSHLFALFDAGISPQRRIALSLPDRMTVIRNDRVWIPIETTLLGSAFAAAWEAGATEFSTWLGRDELSVFETHQGWTDYPPPSLGAVEPLQLPESMGIEKALAADAKTISQWQEDHLRTAYSAPPGSGTPEGAVADDARMLAEAGALDQAAVILQSALQSKPSSAELRNGFGNVLFCRGLLDSAAVVYNSIGEESSHFLASQFNLGVLELNRDNPQRAWKHLSVSLSVGLQIDSLQQQVLNAGGDRTKSSSHLDTFREKIVRLLLDCRAHPAQAENKFADEAASLHDLLTRGFDQIASILIW